MNTTTTTSAQELRKTVRIGTSKTPAGRSYSIYCRILIKDGRLSITGVEGPTRGGNCIGSAGQIILSGLQVETFAPGWSQTLLNKFSKVWQEWHLNDMQAGTPEQHEALKNAPEHEYTKACEYLKSVGLYEVPDPRPGREGQTYQYGQAWLRVELPQDVVDFLAALPDADQTPAWI